MADIEVVGGDSPFGYHEEEAIISFALDFPEIFAPMIHFVDQNHFTRIECKYIIAWIIKLYGQYQVVPSRQLLYDKVSRHLTTDNPYKEILGIVERKSDPREVPIIRTTLREWAESKQYGLLYSDEAITAYHQRDYIKLREIFEGVSKINASGAKCYWFFDRYEELLVKQDTIERCPTGFPRLDRDLNDGGPCPGEVLIWMAATNVGKCLTLDSKIIEHRLSRVFELELDDGAIVKLVGCQEVQTARGIVKVCDLSEGDDIVTVLPLECSEYADAPSVRVPCE